MTNAIILVKALDSPPPTPRLKREKLKPRRQRRQEMRDALKSSAKVNAPK